MAVQTQEPEKKSRYLHVRVVDNSKEGHPVVNVKIPARVVRFGVQMAQTFSPQIKNANVDWEAITAMLEEGDLGKIVEVEDEAENRTVEVWLE